MLDIEVQEDVAAVGAAERAGRAPRFEMVVLLALLTANVAHTLVERGVVESPDITREPSVITLATWSGLAIVALALVSVLVGRIVGRLLGPRLGPASIVIAGGGVLGVQVWVMLTDAYVDASEVGLFDVWAHLLVLSFVASGAGVVLAAVVARRGGSVAGRLPQLQDVQQPALAVIGWMVSMALLLWLGNASTPIPIANVYADVGALVLALAVRTGLRRGSGGIAGVAGLLALSELSGMVSSVVRGFPLGVLETGVTLLATYALPLVLAGVVGRLAQSDEAATQTTVEGRRRNLVRLGVVNLLNVVDAGVTGLLLARGTGEELNPVIDVIGLPGKVVLVAVGSYALFRLRPEALRWVLVPLAAVVCYHLAGAVVSGV